MNLEITIHLEILKMKDSPLSDFTQEKESESLP